MFDSVGSVDGGRTVVRRLRLKCLLDDSKSGKIVVGMQHPPTTFHGMAITPKKSADACLFRFTDRQARSKL
jgi:hypothetical protein